MMRRLTLRIALSLVTAFGGSLSLGLATPTPVAEAVGTEDPTARQLTANTALECSGCGQTFTANFNNIVAFDMTLCGNSQCNGGAGNNSPTNVVTWIVRQYLLPYGTAPTLATVSNVNMNTNGTATHIVLPAQLALTVGTKYEIKAVPAGGIIQAGINGNGYAFGGLTSAALGGEVGNIDLAFKVYYNAVVPRPTTTGIFRPSDGHLFLKNQNTSGFANIDITFGVPGDKPVAGNWDGNATDTIGVYRNGTFFLRNTNSTGFADVQSTFGVSTDLPVVGDWNNDGTDTIGLYRNGLFILSNSNTSPTANLQFALGITGDQPISGDWNGDGTDTVGVFRPSDGHIFLKNTNSSGIADIDITFGIPADKPLTGDWNGDGIDTIGVYRNGQMLLRNTNTTGVADLSFALGIAGDSPIAGDWDGLP